MCHNELITLLSVPGSGLCCFCPAAATAPNGGYALAFVTKSLHFLLFYQVSNLSPLMLLSTCCHKHYPSERQNLLPVRSGSGKRDLQPVYVVLHLVKRCRFTVAVNHFFTLFAARTGNNRFVGINFDDALGDDSVPVKVTTLPCLSRDCWSDSMSMADQCLRLRQMPECWRPEVSWQAQD